ncbi:transposase [Sphingomonas sp. 1185]
MRMIADRIDALLADKGYDSDAVGDALTSMDVEAVIPTRRNRRNPAAHDRVKYRWRNQIERMFNRLKNWRRVATRYDKTAESYIGFISLASALLWFPFVYDA